MKGGEKEMPKIDLSFMFDPTCECGSSQINVEELIPDGDHLTAFGRCNGCSKKMGIEYGFQGVFDPKGHHLFEE